MNTFDEDESEDAQADRELAELRRHCGQLSETWDSIQIICTRSNLDGNTTYASQGIGNWYARYGSVREWVIKEEEKAKEGVRD